jgi:hypothetical protein
MMGLILVLECLLSGVHGRLWVRPFKPGIKCCCFIRTRLHGHLPGIGEPQAWLPGARYMLSRGLGVRQTGLTGTEILPAHGYQDRGKDRCGLLPGLLLFSLVVPPLQRYTISGMGYLIPQSFAAGGNWAISRFLGCNQWPVVLGVQDPDSSPRAFHRVGGRGCSLNRRHNRYSYVTTGTAAGFDGEAMGIKPLWS